MGIRGVGHGQFVPAGAQRRHLRPSALPLRFEPRAPSALVPRSLVAGGQCLLHGRQGLFGLNQTCRDHVHPLELLGRCVGRAKSAVG